MWLSCKYVRTYTKCAIIYYFTGYNNVHNYSVTLCVGSSKETTMQYILCGECIMFYDALTVVLYIVSLKTFTCGIEFVFIQADQVEDHKQYIVSDM